MVSTRHHPKEFPEPATPSHNTPTTTATTPSTPPPKSPAKSTALAKSPTKSPTKRKSNGSASASTSAGASVTSPTISLPPPVAASKSTKPSGASRSTVGYSHTPSRLAFRWFLISIPLVIWDSLYIFLRPHSMPGGKYHSPIWTPYAIYVNVDYVYGWPAWNNGVGFTAAQGTMNMFETAGYLFYIAVVWQAIHSKGIQDLLIGTGPRPVAKSKLMGIAVLVLWATSCATITKTLLYWFNEYFSGFENIGHNSWPDLFVYWIFPNGCWLVLPSIVAYELGTELESALYISTSAKKVR